MTKTTPRVACAACAETKTSFVHKGIRYDDSRTVVRCGGCGLVRLDPFPSTDELRKFYADSYRAEHEPDVDPAAAHQRDLPEARSRVTRLRSILTPGASLLELGTSSGAFLDSARPYVKDVVGIEPTSTHREWAKRSLGLTMYSDLSEAGSRKFDIIVLFHVLEHVLQPVDFLRSLLERLTPGGTIGIEVPNVDDALISLYRVDSYPAFYFQDAHLWYFSKETLAKTCARAGASANITGLQRYDLSNHFRWMLTGKAGGLGYYSNIFPPSLDAAYGEALIRAGCSDTLWALLKKAA